MLVTILIALGITVTATVVSQAAFDYPLPKWIVLGVYLLAYLIVHQLRRSPPAPQFADEPDPDYSHLPTSGPIGRFGQLGLMAVFFTTNLLSLFNPRQARELFKQLAGNAELAKREKESGDNGCTYQTKARYTLPFRGQWLVYNGGMTPKTSHSWDVLGQRFALDFVVANEDFARHTGRGTRPEDYLCYGKEILAAAGGTVIATRSDVKTAPLLGWGVCDFTARSFVGNYVLIRHAAGEFGLYAHLIPDSVAVKTGDTVERGQVVGLCGHTGHSSEPHLHFHLQDSEDLFRGMGLPVLFSGPMVDGEPVAAAHLKAGQRVSSSDSR